MEETFKLIGQVTSLIPYKDSSWPQRLAVVEAKSRKDAAAAAARRLLSGLSCPSVCPRQQNCNIGFRDIGLNAVVGSSYAMVEVLLTLFFCCCTCGHSDT